MLPGLMFLFPSSKRLLRFVEIIFWLLFSWEKGEITNKMKPGVLTKYVFKKEERSGLETRGQ